MYFENLKIAESANIVKEAVVVGDVQIGEESCVLFHAVLRGDDGPVSVGSRSNIQDNCTVHSEPGFPVVIGNEVTVGHNCIIHGCTIGDGSLIGMGSIVLNGAKIGRNCLIGAGSLVLEGQVIPDGMMAVGSPAKVKRALTQENLDMLTESWEEYVKTGKILREEGLTR